MRNRRPALRRPLGHQAADRAQRFDRSGLSARRWTSRQAAAPQSARVPQPRCCRGLNILGDDFAVRSGSAEAADVDAELLRQASRLRRQSCRTGRRHVGSRGGRRPQRRRPRPCPSFVRSASGPCRRRLLARLQQPRDGLPDRHDVADLCRHAAEDALGLRLDFDDGLVGLDLEEQFAFRDLLALFLSPGNQLARFLGHLEGGHDDAYGHGGIGVKKKIV